MSRALGMLLSGLVMIHLWSGSAAAQDSGPPTDTTAVTAPMDTTELPPGLIPVDTALLTPIDTGPSAGGAFLRSLVIPGWGQAAFGDYIRGGVYFAGQAANAFMLVKTISHLQAANEIERRRVAAVRDSLLTAAASDSALFARLQDPGALADAISATPGVADIRELVAAREQQREDWIAWMVFWTLANAIDAYVTAQLEDFPADIFAQRRQGGGLRIGARLPAGGTP